MSKFETHDTPCHTEQNADGTYYTNDDSPLNRAAVQKVIKQIPRRGRPVDQRVPTIYVDDGSGGTNLKNTYSYPVYNTGGPPSIRNGYTNNYPGQPCTPYEVNHIAVGNLHPTGDSGGYSDYTISYRLPGR